MTKNTIGIDFGTVHTYVAVCAANNRNVEALQLDGSRPEVPTEILYSDIPNIPHDIFPMIGRFASETYGECTADEIAANHYRYRGTFKPDIVKSTDARKCAIDFLQALLREAKKNNTSINPLDHRVFFGVPAEANEEYRSTLKQLANEAGFGNVELVEEPKGAMLSDLGSGTTVSLADMLRGYLVMDFGGGTCDFTFFQDGVIKHSWGDMHLGGRLIDDLFWQWFCETTPDFTQELVRTGNDFYCRAVQCREVKEWFSDTLNRNPHYTGNKQVGNTGERISNLCKAEFERRARNYKPSSEFLAFQKLSGNELPEKLTNGKAFDFLQWFADCTKQGLQDGGIAPKDIAVVSLAGGSSRWYFVADYCKEILKLDEKQLTQNREPYAAIAKGIAMLPAIEKEFADKKERINNEKTAFIKDSILPRITESFVHCGERIADNVVGTLFDEKIKPLLLTFRSNGGTVSALEKDIAAVAAVYQSQLEQIANETLSGELQTTFNTAQNKLCQWLSREFGLHLQERQEDWNGTEIDAMGQQDMNIIGDVMMTIKVIVGGIVGIIVAGICGGGGAALLMSGPIGWILGLLIGIVAATAALRGINGKDIPITSWMLYPILTDAKISSLRDKMGTDIKNSVTKACNNALGKIESVLNDMLQQEVNRLSIVNVT